MCKMCQVLLNVSLRQHFCNINRQKLLYFPPGCDESQIQKCFIPAEEIAKLILWKKIDFSLAEKNLYFLKL